MSKYLGYLKEGFNYVYISEQFNNWFLMQRTYHFFWQKVLYKVDNQEIGNKPRGPWFNCKGCGILGHSSEFNSLGAQIRILGEVQCLDGFDRRVPLGTTTTSLNEHACD